MSWSNRGLCNSTQECLAVIDRIGWVVVAACVLLILTRREELKKLSSYDSSPIDWCEINYEVNPNIAEFHNSWTSVVIAAVAPFSIMAKSIPQRFWKDVNLTRSVVCIMVLIVLIGVGSTYFHATLSVTGQVMDEMGIIWLVLYSALYVLPYGEFRLLREAAVMRSVFIGFVLSTALLGLFLPIISHVLVLSTCPFGLYVHGKAVKRSKNAAAKARYKYGFRFFAAAWACWLTDRLACPQMRALRDIIGFQPQLHAAWHLLISVVTFLLVGTLSMFRDEEYEKEIQMENKMEIV